MFEKYSEASLNEAGGGGEYEVVVGFGWSNGVLIWVADTFGDKLQTPACAGAQNITDMSFSPSPSVSTRDARASTGRALEKERSAIQLDPWDAQWTARSVGGLA